MDIGTGLALLGSAKLAVRLLGPTAEYIGEGVKSFVQNRVNNVNRIFNKAITKLGNKIEDEGSVSPKVLRRILDDGSYCDDELSAEYFGGVLASSRSANSRDDRGVVLLDLIGRMSTYQIRTHYIIYNVIKRIFDGSDYKFNLEDRSKMEIFIPWAEYCDVMEYSEDEFKRSEVLLNHTMFGLHKERLIENFHYGSENNIKEYFAKATTHGILCSPSALGAELFLWVHGISDQPISTILLPEQKFSIENPIKIPVNALPTKEPNKGVGPTS